MTDTLPTQEEVTSQLERMLTSGDFQAQPRQTAFLKFVVEQTLAGNSHEIKGYTLATKVFGRGPDFDQNTNPIVSIHAAKLRNALDLYYLTAGKEDAVRISIPKGSYVPSFTKRVVDETHAPTLGDEEAKDLSIDSWPCVCVHSFKNLARVPELEHWSVGLATELATELTRYPDVRVMVNGSNDVIVPKSRGACRFEIQGSFHSNNKYVKVAVVLIDSETGAHVWTDTHRFPTDMTELPSYQEDVARLVSAKIAGEYGVIARTIAPRLANTAPRKLTTYEACLRFYEFDSKYTQESFFRALQALENAVQVDPECGQIWSMLGRLYGTVYAFGYPGFENSLDKAYECAHKGVSLAPEDQRCRIIRAFIHLVRDNIEIGRQDADYALKLRPNSLFMLDGIGYVMTLLGEWERGPALIHEVIRSNPFYLNLVHYSLWLDWIRRENYEQAYRETQHLNSPALFWEHLAAAASLGQLDRIEEGQKSLSKLLALKPDFPLQGGILIRRYIKFDELVERVVKGLNRLGLEIR